MPRRDLYQMQVVGRVLCVKLKNVWSRGVVEAVYSEVQELVKDIQSEPWAAYVDIRDWIMPTMEALNGFQKIYDWCAENNQTHEATVCRFDTQKHIIGDVSSYEPEFHFFTQKAQDASAWLNQQGFEFTLPDKFK